MPPSPHPTVRPVGKSAEELARGCNQPCPRTSGIQRLHTVLPGLQLAMLSACLCPSSHSLLISFFNSVSLHSYLFAYCILQHLSSFHCLNPLANPPLQYPGAIVLCSLCFPRAWVFLTTRSPFNKLLLWSQSALLWMLAPDTSLILH